MVGTWLAEIRSCSCLPVLPDSAWVLLNKIYQPFFTSQYTDYQKAKIQSTQTTDTRFRDSSGFDEAENLCRVGNSFIKAV